MGTIVYKVILVAGYALGTLILLPACAKSTSGLFDLSPEVIAREFNKFIEWKLGLDERRAKGCRQEVKESGIDVGPLPDTLNRQLAAENYEDARATFDLLRLQVRDYDHRVRQAGCPLYLPHAKYQIPTPAFPP